MSVEHSSVGSVPSGPIDLGDGAGPDRARTTWRWAVGVLVVATAALVGHLAVVIASAWLVASTIDAVTGRDVGSLDVVGLLVDIAPGLVVGWCVGLVVALVLARWDALGARVAGCAAGAVGALAGVALLTAAGVL